MKPSIQSKSSPTQHFDYLVIGHVTQDKTENGYTLGGTVSYSAMAAAALGLKVGIITSAPENLDLSPLKRFPLLRIPSSQTTIFENIQTAGGREQYLHQRAVTITPDAIPEGWRNAALVHFGPVANEIDPGLLDIFTRAFKCITPQGCMRVADAEHKVHYRDWLEAETILPKCQAAVISVEDIQHKEERILHLKQFLDILAVTEGERGARIYWHDEMRRFPAPQVEVVDLTGAGDIFAAIFFARLYSTGDAWEAGRQAVQLASLSVTRRGVAGVPTAQEVQAASLKTIPEKN